MNSPRAPYSRRGIRLFLRAQASLPAYFDRLVFWLIVTAFLLNTSPTLFAQTNDNIDRMVNTASGSERGSRYQLNSGSPGSRY
jgi:hypothetical protein